MTAPTPAPPRFALTRGQRETLRSGGARPNHWPYVTLAVLQVADVALTAFVLAIGGAEQNPVARVLTDLGWPGLAALLAVKLGLVAALWRKGARVRLASAIYGAVVANNVFFAVLWIAG